MTSFYVANSGMPEAGWIGGGAPPLILSLNQVMSTTILPPPPPPFSDLFSSYIPAEIQMSANFH